MFQLTKEEFENLRFQFETSRWGGIRYLPYAFTEQGVAMLSSVLNSKRAIQVNIGIMRVFVNIRKLVVSNKVILNKISQLEYAVELHDEKIRTIFEVIHGTNRGQRLFFYIDKKKNRKQVYIFTFP